MLGFRKILEHSQIQKKSRKKQQKSQHFSMLKFLDGQAYYQIIFENNSFLNKFARKIFC